MSDEAGTASGTTRAGHVLTLNSRRLTAHVLRRVAKALGLPISASPDDLRQMIDGALAEREEDPRSVLIAQLDTDEGVVIELRNSDGCFFTISPDLGMMEMLRESRGAERGSPPPSPPLGAVGGADGDTIADPRVPELEREMERLTVTNTALSAEVSGLRDKLQGEKEQRRELWRLNCQHLRELEELIAEKDKEIAALKDRISESGSPIALYSPARVSGGGEPPRSHTAPALVVPPASPSLGELHPSRKGKAPPIDFFDGETGSITFEDWLSTLQRAAVWNNWSDNDCLVQLAGYLRKRALQEWNLLTRAERDTFTSATEALQNRLDPTSRVLAAQEFRHALQRDDEPVTEFIRRLEQLYHKAYGRDKMSIETRDTLLFGQLQEGLTYALMKAPAVSGAQGYQQLCLAARTEERRLIELGTPSHTPSTGTAQQPLLLAPGGTPGTQPPRNRGPGNRPQSDRRSFQCHGVGHFARACPYSQRPPIPPNPPPANTNHVWSHHHGPQPAYVQHPLPYPDSHGSKWIQDRGSRPQHARVNIEGVPAEGIIDSGSDITIMGADLFRKVSAVGRLKRRNFKQVDKVPHTYDKRPFSLDGRMDMQITFGGATIKTPIYVKLDAPEQLLLSEGVCRQLQIIAYHPAIILRIPSPANTGQKRLTGQRQKPHLPISSTEEKTAANTTTPTEQRTPLTPAEEKTAANTTTPTEQRTPLTPAEEKTAANTTTPTEQRIAPLTPAEEKTAANTTTPTEQRTPLTPAEENTAANTTTPTEQRIAQHSEATPPAVTPAEHTGQRTVVPTNTPPPHIEGNMPGYTPTLAESREYRTFTTVTAHQPQAMVTGTTTEHPERKAVVATTPPDHTVVVHTTTNAPAYTLHDTPRNWAPSAAASNTSGITDGPTQLTTGMTTEATPCTHIPLDQSISQIPNCCVRLVTSVRVLPDQSIPALVTLEGVPQLLTTLNPPDGRSFVSVYIDDVVIYSETMEDHLHHLRQVLKCLQDAGLKLKLSKCSFICKEVEFLGHRITPDGLQTTTRLVSAVQEFPRPKNVKQTRQFLGLCSFYRRFIQSFANIAKPLHQLTKKGVTFVWTTHCGTAFLALKKKLCEAPVLAYPSFDKDFSLETDASIDGIGAVLSQQQLDRLLHPVAFASQSLSPAERNYAITDLETLAVVWALPLLPIWSCCHCLHRPLSSSRCSRHP